MFIFLYCHYCIPSLVLQLLYSLCGITTAVFHLWYHPNVFVLGYHHHCIAITVLYCHQCILSLLSTPLYYHHSITSTVFYFWYYHHCITSTALNSWRPHLEEMKPGNKEIILSWLALAPSPLKCAWLGEHIVTTSLFYSNLPNSMTYIQDGNCYLCIPIMNPLLPASIFPPSPIPSPILNK